MTDEILQLPSRNAKTGVAMSAADNIRRPKDRRAFRDLILSEQGPKSAAARFVAVALIQRMDSASLESYVSAETIGKLTALNERTVRRALKRLVAEGWIVERTKAKGRDFWLKIRRAALPPGLADNLTGSHENGLTDRMPGSQGYPQPDEMSGSHGGRLVDKSDSTGGQIARADPDTESDDPGKRSRIRDPGPRPAVATRQRGQTEPDRDQQLDSRIRAYLRDLPQHRNDLTTIAKLAKCTEQDVRRVRDGT
jgi:hypothetical protein